MLAAAHPALALSARPALRPGRRANALRAGARPAGRVLVACCVVLAHAIVLALLARAATITPASFPAPVVQVSLLGAARPAQHLSAAAPAAAAAVPPQPVRPTQRPAVPVTPLARAAAPAMPAQPVPAAVPAPVPQPGQAATGTPPASLTAAPAPAGAAQAEAPAAAAVIAPPRFDAAYLDNPTPAYPPLSRRLREEGEVRLRVRVTADGKAAAVELRDGSGFDRLDRAALEAVARWRFVPARQGDQAVEAWVLVPIVFKLQGN